MAKHTYRVVTEYGTFTRTTARIYTHVVASLGKDAAHLSREARSAKAAAEQNIAYYQALQAGTKTSSYTPEQVANGIESEIKRIARWSDPVFLADQAATITEWGWASRQDLAEKVAAKARNYGYQAVRIFEVK